MALNTLTIKSAKPKTKKYRPPDGSIRKRHSSLYKLNQKKRGPLSAENSH